MAPAELGEYLFGGARPAVSDVVQALPDCLVHIGACRDVEQTLGAISSQDALQSRSTSAAPAPFLVSLPTPIPGHRTKIRL